MQETFILNYKSYYVTICKVLKWQKCLWIDIHMLKYLYYNPDRNRERGRGL